MFCFFRLDNLEEIRVMPMRALGHLECGGQERFRKVSSRRKGLDRVVLSGVLLWEYRIRKFFSVWCDWQNNVTCVIRERLEMCLTWNFIILSNSGNLLIIPLFASKFPCICYRTRESGIFQTPGGFGSWLQSPETNSGYFEKKC